MEINGKIRSPKIGRAGRRGDNCRLEYEKVLKKVYHLFTNLIIWDKCD